MAVRISTYLANKILDHVFRNTTYTPPATIYAKMHTGDPGEAGNQTTSESTFAAAAAGVIAISNTPEFTLNASETITHVSFWDASTAGNFLYSVAASVSKSGVNNDIIRISTNTVGFTPLAA